VNTSLDEFFPEGCGVEIIAEPGRFYVAAAFTLMTQIHSIREVMDAEGRNSFMYYINDGVYGSFNCVLYDHAEVTPETLRGSDENEDQFRCSIWGPTCDGMDKVCSNVFLPAMNMSDWLLFADMGAYTLVAAGTFNGFPISKIQYIATNEAWYTLKEFFPADNLVTENVPVFMKPAVGMDRDRIGWIEDTDPRCDLLMSELIFNQDSGPAGPDGFFEYSADNITAQ